MLIFVLISRWIGRIKNSVILRIHMVFHLPSKLHDLKDNNMKKVTYNMQAMKEGPESSVTKLTFIVFCPYLQSGSSRLIVLIQPCFFFIKYLALTVSPEGISRICCRLIQLINDMSFCLSISSFKMLGTQYHTIHCQILYSDTLYWSSITALSSNVNFNSGGWTSLLTKLSIM